MAKASANIKDLDALERKVRLAADKATGIAKKSLYDGAKIAADALRARVDGLDRVTDVEWINAARRREQTLLSVSQKNGLRNSLGIEKMKVESTTVYTTVRFHGYNTVKTKSYPDGQPNALIAASCEKGTSRMTRQRFIEPCLRENRSEILRAMIRTATEELGKIIET